MGECGMGSGVGGLHYSRSAAFDEVYCVQPRVLNEVKTRGVNGPPPSAAGGHKRLRQHGKKMRRRRRRSGGRHVRGRRRCD